MIDVEDQFAHDHLWVTEYLINYCIGALTQWPYVIIDVWFTERPLVSHRQYNM